MAARSAANGPTASPAGRPARVNTGSTQIVHALHQAFAIELQVPLTHITRYDPLVWPSVARAATPHVIERAYARLSCAFPHPTASATEYAYVAGFADGDGCVSAVLFHTPGRKSAGYRLRLQLGCNDAGALQDCQAILGARGSIYQVRRSVTVSRQMWTLNYDGVHALHAVSRIVPYMRIKGPQAIALLAFWFHGRQWVNPGPSGTPAPIRAARQFWYRRIAAMK